MTKFSLVRGCIVVLVTLCAVVAAALIYLARVPPESTVVESDRYIESDQISFLVIGDQGSGQLPQWRVASAMAAAVRADSRIRFCVLLGDNFYGDGVESTVDLQWRWKFESMYGDQAFWTMPFYAVLGNHDYLGNVQAQLDYGRQDRSSNRFKMPALQYVRDFGRIGERPLARIAFMNSNDGANDYQAARTFIAEAFSRPGPDPLWHIVVAHHPLQSFGRYRGDRALHVALLPALSQAGVQLYLAGHDHNMELIDSPGEPVVAISGGGGASVYPQTGAGPALRYFSATHGYLKVAISRAAIDLDFEPIGREPQFLYSVLPAKHGDQAIAPAYAPRRGE